LPTIELADSGVLVNIAPPTEGTPLSICSYGNQVSPPDRH